MKTILALFKGSDLDCKRRQALPALFAMVGFLLAGSRLASGQSAAADGFAPEINGPVYAMALQEDGRIVLGGEFTIVCGQSRTNLARLNPDGTIDHPRSAQYERGREKQFLL